MGPCLKNKTKQNPVLYPSPTSLFFFFFLKISCPGVFLPDKQDVYLGVYLLNQYLETACFPSVFPIMIQQRMTFEKVILTFSLLNGNLKFADDHLMVFIKNTVFMKLFCKFPFKKLLEGTSEQYKTIVEGLAFVAQV